MKPKKPLKLRLLYCGFTVFLRRTSVAFFSLFLEIFVLCFKKQVHCPQSLNLVCLNATGTSVNLSLTLLQRKISVRVAWTASYSIGKWGKSEVGLFLVGSLCLHGCSLSSMHFNILEGLWCPNKGSCGLVSSTFHWVNTSDVSTQIVVLFRSYPMSQISIFCDSRNKLTC